MSKANEIHKEVARLTEENNLYRLLGSKDGFFLKYFNEIPKHKNRVECFNSVNESFYNLFGHYKYSSFFSFSNQYKKYVENKSRNTKN